MESHDHALSAADSQAERAARLAGNYVFPASSGQQRLWFLRELDEGSAASYHLPCALRIAGALQPRALEAALNQIVARHEALRTSFAFVDGELLQVIAPDAAVELPLVDLGDQPAAAQRAQIERLSLAEAQRPFDFAQSPLLRALLLRCSATEHLLLVTLHHIVADGWSLTIFLSELAALYAAAVEGAPAALAELPIQYADWAAWQREWLQSEAVAPLLAYWRDRLNPVGNPAPTTLDLPTDRPRPEQMSYQGATHTFTLAAPLTEALQALSQQRGTTLYMTLLAAFEALLWRYTGQDQFLLGTPIASRDRPELEGIVGFFANTLVLRADLGGAPTFDDLLARVRQDCLGAYAHQALPFEKLVEELHHERDIRRNPLFQVLFSFQSTPLATIRVQNLTLTPLAIDNRTAKFDLSLDIVAAERTLHATLTYSSDLFDAATIERLARHFQALLSAAVAEPARPVAELPLLSEDERQQIVAGWNRTQAAYPRATIHSLIEQQAAQTPDAVAAVGAGQQLRYGELNRRANQLARQLQALGVGGQPQGELRVGICVTRSPELIVGLLAILKAGGAYVPLDPAYPRERLAMMIADAGVSVVVTEQSLAAKLPPQDAQIVLLDADWPTIARWPDADLAGDVAPEQAAYVIYTSGSTGTPKGVIVSHANVVNFFSAMDQRIAPVEPGVWLALTSISFDISVLELFWTLARGFAVVVQPDREQTVITAGPRSSTAHKPIDFSLFYFANDERESSQDKYRLLIEGARFADEHGFAAVWTPERHFHTFGGLYPNPAVTSAAIAAVTTRVQIRAGSVVLPLHSPIRVAEDWAVVDNLSHGRVGISFASGWHANDFVFAPAHYAERKAVMLREIETVRRLWRGETLAFAGGGGDVAVQTLPRPVQPELPIWLTAAGNPETFRMAGEIGASLLTHLLGQSIDELEAKIASYRAAWQQRHPGTGHVTLMLHTFVDDDMATVREKVRQPFKEYLLSSIDLMRSLAQSIGQGLDPRSLAPQDMQQLVELSFDRYFETSGLFGTPDSCMPMVERLRQIGVDEIGCLVDFGVDADSVLTSLHALNTLRERSAARDAEPDEALAAQIERYQVTHLQCTPSLAQLLAASDEALAAMGGLKMLLVGGETFPAEVARRLRAALPATIVNMYGPTETTIWSATHPLAEVGPTVPIGRPIANTQIYILDRRLEPVPVGVTGELYIGGAGVARGYLHRPALTAERFLPDPFGDGARLYRTGDLARYRADGTIEFLGRVDQQVKIRGHRIELGEIEALLRQHRAVREAVVIARDEANGERRLVAYVVGAPSASNQEPAGSADGSAFSALGAPAELRTFLQQHLPSYMIPSAFVMLDALPLTPNGKLDRRALPAPELLRDTLASAYVAPRSDLEHKLAAIWARLLGLERVGAHDNFFELGGHSLLFVRLVEEIRVAFRVELPFRDLFLTPTVAYVAQCLERAMQHVPRATDDEHDLRALVDGISDEDVDLLLSDPLIMAGMLGASLSEDTDR